jgi:hypothetical protein
VIHSENGTGNGKAIQKFIIYAEGVFVGAHGGQAISSTP